MDIKKFMKNFKMNNLKKIRESKKITQIKLSVDLEVSQELISQYEIGKTIPTTPNLIQLADYFKCSTDYLLERTNNPTMYTNLSNNDLEIANIINIYCSLSDANKKHFISYLEYLNKT